MFFRILLLLFVFHFTFAEEQDAEELDVRKKDINKEENFPAYLTFGKCSASETIHEFLKNYYNPENTFVQVSCGICTKPVKFYYSPKNRRLRLAQTPTIPLYANLFEYAIIRTNLVRSVSGRVYFSDTCYYEVKTDLDLIRTHGTDMHSIALIVCTAGDKKCTRIHGWERGFNNNFTVISVVIKIYPDQNILVAISSQADKLASAFINKTTTVIIKNTKCLYNGQQLTAKIQTIISEDFSIDWSSLEYKPIIFPCSPGGFAFHPATGRFVENKNYIRKAYKTKENLKNAISILYPKWTKKFKSCDLSYNDRLKKPCYITLDGGVETIENSFCNQTQENSTKENLNSTKVIQGPIQNIKTKLGEDARLVCTVENITDFEVAWSHKKSGAILTVGNRVWTSNKRINLTVEPNKWILEIKNVTINDGGDYLCQVSKWPPIMVVGTISIVDSNGNLISTNETVIPSPAPTTLKPVIKEVKTQLRVFFNFLLAEN